MNIERILEALEENDKTSAKIEMELMFEEKLERKIWKIYKSLEEEFMKDLIDKLNKS